MTEQSGEEIPFESRFCTWKTESRSDVWVWRMVVRSRLSVEVCNYESRSRPSTGGTRSADTEMILKLGWAGLESLGELRLVCRRADFWRIESMRVTFREGAVDAMADRRKFLSVGWAEVSQSSKP